MGRLFPPQRKEMAELLQRRNPYGSTPAFRHEVWTSLPSPHGPTRSTKEATSPTRLLAPKAQALEEAMGNISIPIYSDQICMELLVPMGIAPGTP